MAEAYALRSSRTIDLPAPPTLTRLSASIEEMRSTAIELVKGPLSLPLMALDSRRAPSVASESLSFRGGAKKDLAVQMDRDEVQELRRRMDVDIMEQRVEQLESSISGLVEYLVRLRQGIIELNESLADDLREGRSRWTVLAAAPLVGDLDEGQSVLAIVSTELRLYCRDDGGLLKYVAITGT